MKTHLHILPIYLILLISNLAQAATLQFTPATPSVVQGERITLLVSGTKGEITWTANRGRIEGSGAQVTYIAPSQLEKGETSVVVLDAEGNTGLLKIKLLPKPIEISAKNAVWDIFINRISIKGLALDGQTLWVGTTGGLEQWNVTTGTLQRVFTNLDGLPSDFITSLQVDGNGGLWMGIGGIGGGLTHRNADGQWQVFNKDNSGLPDNWISSLQLDGNGGLWVGTWGSGLAHRSADGQWQVFDIQNSGLPNSIIYSLQSDGNGGLWAGTWGGGLAHRSADGQWQVFDTKNSSLPYNLITFPQLDGNGGLWVGTSGGLAHRSADGQWQVFNKDNSSLPDDWISPLQLDGNGGLWVGTWGSGLAHRSTDGQWQVFNKDNSGLPDNRINSLQLDGNGGLWVGTSGGLVHRDADGQWQVFNSSGLNNSGLNNWIVSFQLLDGNGDLWVGTNGGLTHRNANGQWQVFDTQNSGLPSSNIYSLQSDGNGGLWVGTDNGLAHRSANGQWQVFDTKNSGLPYNSITSLQLDGNGGLWMGNSSSLVHRSADGQWQIFDTKISGLPNSGINSLQLDSNGGLWAGTWSGSLAHRNADGQWQVFNKDNSGLPGNNIYSLQSDGNGGLWVATDSGLAHRSTNGQWQVFNENNSGLPNNRINSLQLDGNGRLWMVTGNGLVHRSADGQWQVFDTKNSGLPNNWIYSLLLDGNDGLWLIVADPIFGNSLTHVTFTQRTKLCTQTNETNCQKIQGKHAAILIAGGGAQRENTLWDTTEFIANYGIYKMLSKRGFNNDEIYYLSPKQWADFNGDGYNDRIVDAPIPERDITLNDVKEAFAWAKKQGKLDQPLYLFFVDHGGSNRLQLGKNSILEIKDLKYLLDDYQAATQNEVVVVLEACYSGALLDQLKAPKRGIISSTNNGLAYLDRTSKQGFTLFFANGLLKGMNFTEAFDYATTEQKKLLKNLSSFITGGQSAQNLEQEPRLEDNQQGQWLRTVNINGNFVVGDLSLAVQAQTKNANIIKGQNVTLQAKTTIARGEIKRVWAVVKPPKMNLVLDSYGTPILAFSHVILGQDASNKELWQTTWQDSVYNGAYEILFYAEDNQGNIASSEPVIITVTNGIEPPAQAQVKLTVDKTQYKPGDKFTVKLTEQLGWGYDLYAAVVMPDGNFLALQDTNQPYALNQPKPWRKLRKQGQTSTLFDLTLPANLPTGNYCIYGILSPEGQTVFEQQAQWIMEKRCVLVN